MRDENGPFAKVFLDVLHNKHLQAIDIRVYAELRSHYNETKQLPVFPSQSTIALSIGCSVDTVGRSTKRLIKERCLIVERGKRHFSNRYSFPLLRHRINADTVPAYERVATGMDAVSESAPLRHQLERYNQKHETEKPLRLYHGSDIASVMENGNIRIATQQGWREYSGGDEDAFIFGHLRGTEARLAAVKKYGSSLNGYANS